MAPRGGQRSVSAKEQLVGVHCFAQGFLCCLGLTECNHLPMSCVYQHYSKRSRAYVVISFEQSYVGAVYLANLRLWLTWAFLGRFFSYPIMTLLPVTMNLYTYGITQTGVCQASHNSPRLLFPPPNLFEYCFWSWWGPAWNILSLCCFISSIRQKGKQTTTLLRACGHLSLWGCRCASCQLTMKR